MGLIDQKLLPTAADVEGAVQRLKGVAVRTPLINAPVLDERLGARVFLKAEILQRTGSFKFRGAYNRLSQIPAGRRGAGVVAFSSGNHAQGVAAAAKLLGMRATIVMPDDAPKAKLSRTRALGAEVVTYDRAGGEDRAAIAEGIVKERGATLVPPYDDPMIIAGQGTIGVEIAEDLDRLGLKPEIVVVGASGGGLAAGVSLGIKSRAASARLFTAEPEDFDDTLRSFLRGERVANDKVTGSICDALMSNTPGEWTFPINKELIGQGISASDEEVAAAVRYAFHELKLVVEPGGAIGLAALLAGKLDNVVDIRGKTVVAILSGGNVDVEMYAKLIAG
ncbi:MAG: threonine/serine dehydratase [Pseudolabrys sp.]|jgi:threonine dehydratase